MYQQITIVGNLGRDPEMRYTPSGVPVTNFSVATSRRFTNRDGELTEKTVWFKVSVWNKPAENCAQYLNKGSRVLVVGEMEEPEVWKNNEGTHVASLKIRADKVQFLTPRGESNGAQHRQAATEPMGPDPMDEDIPF